MSSRRNLFIALGVLFAIYWIGAFGYMAIGRLVGPEVRFFDALYMVAITIPTVGYREVVPETFWFELWTIVIVVFGVSAAAIAVSSFTGLIVSGEIGRMIGSRKLESRIKHLTNHVIVCGFGRMGRLVVQRLMERHVPLVVVEHDAQACRLIEELGQLYVIADASEESALEKAGIEHARALVTVLASDADNVFVALSARQLNPGIKIIARAEQMSSVSKLSRAGADRVISTQAIGAERIVNVLTRPHLVDFVDVAARGVELEMGEFVVSPSSPIAGKTLLESNIRQAADVMVVAIRREDGTTRFNPGASEIMEPKDTLITIGPLGAVSRLEALEISSEADEP